MQNDQVSGARFSYITYDAESAALQQEFKKQFEALECLSDKLPGSRPKSLFLTTLEEAYMWIGKAIRDAQIARSGFEVTECPTRGEE